MSSQSELEQYLETQSVLYYTNGISDITDEEFDSLKGKLPKEFNKVGMISTSNKISLPYPITSLNKVKTEKEIKLFTKKYTGPYIISPKVDGVAGVYYKNKLYSRGDGKNAQNLSHLLDYISLPKLYDDMCIRGELYIQKSSFEKYIHPTYKNIRASVCSQIKNTDPNIAKHLHFVVHSIVHPRMKYSEQLLLLKKLEFKNIINSNYITEIDEIMLGKKLETLKREVDYDMDGLVIVDDSKSYDLTDDNPKFSFAFKLDTEEQTEITTVTGLTWEKSRDCYLIPTIQVEPIVIGGNTIKNITGNNARYIIDNGIGEGSIVKVIRSGDVIPKILTVVKKSINIILPEPNTYDWNETKIHMIAHEKDDSVKIKELLHFFVSLDIKFINIGIVTKLYAGGLDSIFKIINTNFTDITGEKVYTKIKNEINNALENSRLSKIMNASNIFPRGLGEKKLDLVVKAFPNLLELDELPNKKITGFTVDSLKNISKYLVPFQTFYKEIKSNSNDVKQIVNQEIKSNLLQDAKVVFTMCRNTSVENFIEKNGGKVMTSISSKTTLIIYGGSESSVKLNKAIQLNIPRMTIQQFAEKYKLTDS